MNFEDQHYFAAVHQIILTGHRITEQISRELKEFEVSEPQYNVLRTLEENKGRPITVQEVLDNMVQRSSNVTRIIDKLLAKGLVSRQECPTNRRKMDIAITREGSLFLKKLDKKVYAFHQPMMKRLTVEEIQTLTALIKKLKGNRS